MNTISYKQSYEKLNEIHKNEPNAFNDPNLLIKIFYLLSSFKFRQPLRRFVLSLFENCLSSFEILERSQQIIERLGEDIF